MQLLRQQILDLIAAENRFITKREFCQLLGIKGAKRRDLKATLEQLKNDGLYGKNDSEKAPYPSSRPAIKEKAQSVVKEKVQPVVKEKIRSADVKPTKKIIDRRPPKTTALHKTLMGLFIERGDIATIESTHRKEPFAPIKLSADEMAKAKELLLQHNDVVSFKVSALGRLTLIDRIGNLSEPKVFSLMAIHAADVPFEFPEAAIDLAKGATVPPLGKRTDYRHLPLVTIDGEDARDFDDAVYATPDTDPENPGGWQAIVAIADVANYVHPHDALDTEAYNRGNSIYFADRVVPMLPEALSNEMCSLKPNVDRACLAVEMTISAAGDLLDYQFKRALMRSTARLTYTQVQQAIDAHTQNAHTDKGNAQSRLDTDDETPDAHHMLEHTYADNDASHALHTNGAAQDVQSKAFWDAVLAPLYGTYKCLRKARNRRGSLDLDSIERKVIFDDNGRIKAIVPRIQQTSNQLIEEFMIAANVAAAKVLSAKKWPSLYRVHDKPDDTRVTNMRRLVTSLGIAVPREKSMSAKSFNVILNHQSPYKRMIHDLVLRSQSQAIYSPGNIGHYGLGLTHYAHFTSPIRRYADLCVHRALIESLGLGDGGQEQIPMQTLQQIGEHISTTERTAAQLEREVMDRYLVLHLEDYIGHTFDATIVGVTSVGIFFELAESGAQGFLHVKNLPDDYYIFDEDNHRYVGKRTHRTFQLGDSIQAVLDAADARSSTTVFSLPAPKPRAPRESGKGTKARRGFTKDSAEKSTHDFPKRSYKKADDEGHKLSEKPQAQKNPDSSGNRYERREKMGYKSRPVNPVTKDASETPDKKPVKKFARKKKANQGKKPIQDR